MYERWKKECEEWRLLLRDLPNVLICLFVLSVVSMNLLANKSIDLPVDWLALDCGLLVSWIAFLTLDIVTKHFGPKAASQLSVLAIALNLFMCLVFYICSIIPGQWSQSYVPGSEQLLNTALDLTFGGAWYVLAGSTVAFLLSAVINNFANWGIGQLLCRRTDGFFVYALRSYLSTAIGQFSDNLIFALLVSHFFFGWSLVQCITCALTGMVVELLCEVSFSFMGFRICRRWKETGVGEAYLSYRKAIAAK